MIGRFILTHTGRSVSEKTVQTPIFLVFKFTIIPLFLQLFCKNFSIRFAQNLSL